MKLFKEKVYTVRELAILKTCVLCAGLLIGAYAEGFVKNHLVFFAALGLITYVRAIYFYWFKK